MSTAITQSVQALAARAAAREALGEDRGEETWTRQPSATDI